MKIRNSIISTLGFAISAASSMLLFVGLFSAKWDYITEHLFDTIFVLTLGFLVPISSILGITFFVKSVYPKKEMLFALPLIVGIISLLVTLVYYWMTTFFSFIDLLKIKLAIG